MKQVMTEKDKVVRKTQLLRAKGRILGSLHVAKVRTMRAPECERGLADCAPQEGAPVYSEEIYDDTDFYQQLLKDLIQQKADPQSTQ